MSSKRGRTTERKLLRKKKRHTRKNVVGSYQEKKILILTTTKKGKILDRKMQEEENCILGIPEKIFDTKFLTYPITSDRDSSIFLPHHTKFFALALPLYYSANNPPSNHRHNVDYLKSKFGVNPT